MSQNVTILMQVTSFHDGTFGGGVMLGSDASGKGPLLRARIPARVLPRRPAPGEVWRVSGCTAIYPVHDPQTGVLNQLEHVDATWAAPVPPGGGAIRRWIARNPAIPGVGEGYAERLWDALGDQLYERIRARDIPALAAVLDVPKAAAIVDAFGLLLDEVTALEELDGMGMDGATALVAVRLFGTDAARRVHADPYTMTLLEPWAKVDAAALATGINPTDQRRLLAAIDVAAAQAFRTTESNLGGSTVVTRAGLTRRVQAMLGRSGAGQTIEALNLALTTGLLREVGAERYQARGPDLMERQIEEAVADRLTRPRPILDRAIAAVAIAEVEQFCNIRFESEQIEAVLTALDVGVALIDGGVGTGKTTIVRAILHAHSRLKRGEIAQVALSGRAAKRLSEATGQPAQTIYRFLKDHESGRRVMKRGLLVIDEFSMVGTPELWRLLAAVPVEVDVILVGDPAQLPPIKAGNPAQAFCASPNVPRVTLARIHRQEASTGIPSVANAIRRGFLPELPEFNPQIPQHPGVFVMPASKDDVPAKVMDAFAALSGLPDEAAQARDVRRIHDADVQVLTMTRHGPAGASDLSDAIERRWLSGRPSIHNWGLQLGSKILWIKNSYDRPTGRFGADGREETIDLMNGSLGVVRHPTELGANVRFDDGTEAEILGRDLGSLLRGWAITVHKAQGSAFRTVVIPIVRSRLLDRAMLYTAVTRGRERVVLVGDIALARDATARPAKAALRLQALDLEAGLARRDQEDQNSGQVL